MAKLTAPTLAPGPRKRLSDELHTMHRRAGWPSVRELARALGAGVVSSSRIHDAFTNPRLPAWGLVHMVVVELATRAPGADADAEVKRFHGLWDEAAQADASATTENEPPSEQAVTLAGPERLPSRQDAAQLHAAGMTPRPLESARHLLLIDAGFSGSDDAELSYRRRILNGIIDRVLFAVGVDSSMRQRVDRADAVMELIDCAVPVPDLLRALLTVAPADLLAINRLASESAQVRLRVVLARGFVTGNESAGWVGADLNHAFRLLDADALRAALSGKESDYALCVSEAVYTGIAATDLVSVGSWGLTAGDRRGMPEA
ncbi:hypothetical protein AB0C90_34210 [Streptomyces sp. NPDC048550]|uniref:hypothetical protein n=1 Tax=Streptomyces sp. NPDC048550 TaxID=3155739 RepID=UPI003414335F